MRWQRTAGVRRLSAQLALVRRAGALQQTRDGRFVGLALNSAVAAAVGLTHGGQARARQNGSAVTVEVVIDDRVADGCVRLQSAVSSTVDLGPSYGAIEVEPVSSPVSSPVSGA